MPFPRHFRHQLALGFGLLALVIGLPSTFFVTQVYQDQLIKDRGLALRDALARHNLAAVDLFDELAPALAVTPGAAATQALGAAIADLKFDAALANLPTLAPPTPRLAPATALPSTSSAPLGPTRRPRNRPLSPDTPA